MAPLPVYRLLIVYPEEAVNNEVKKTLFPVLGILLLEITWASIYGCKRYPLVRALSKFRRNPWAD